MNEHRLEQFRENLLQVFAAGDTPFGMGALAAMSHLRSHGFRQPEIDVEKVTAQIEYLVVKGFVAPLEKQMSKGVPLWRITPAGVTWLDEHGF